MGLSWEQKKAILAYEQTNRAKLSQRWDRSEAWYCGDDPDGIQAAGYDGVMRDADDELRIDTNYLYAFVDTSNAVTIPQNPKLGIKPNSKDLKEAAEAREALVNATFRRENLPRKLYRSGLFASLNGEAFCKTIWRPEEKRVVYQILSPRVLFCDWSVPWEECRYVIEAVPYTKEEFEARLADGTFKMPENSTPVYNQIPKWLDSSIDGKNSIYSSMIHGAFERIIVYEFHDLTVPDVTWMLDGQEEPLKVGGQPYKFTRNPYSKLYFNERPQDHGGLADAQLIEQQLAALNHLDKLEFWHTYTTIPKIVVDDSVVDNPEDAVTQLQNAYSPGDIVRPKMNNVMPGKPWLTYTQVPAMLPAFANMRQNLKSQINFELGLSEIQRGITGKADTATEVAIADNATRNRNGTRTGLVKSFIRSIGMNTLAIYREFFPGDLEVELPGKRDHSTVFVDRVNMAFQNEEPSSTNMFGEEWNYDYDVTVGTPSEEDKSVQLQKMATYLPAFLQAPNVDKNLLFEKLAYLLDMKEIISDQPQQTMMVPGQPGSDGNPGQPGSPIEGGMLPGVLDQQHENALPQGIKQMASPPKMEV